MVHIIKKSVKSSLSVNLGSKIIKDHIEKVHPINQLSNGRYYTKLHPQDYKKPGLVNKANMGDVEEAIYQYYLSKEADKIDKKTFEHLYSQWHDDPVGGGKTKPGTMYRTENLYKQYLRNSELEKIPIVEIDAEKFELLFLDCIKRGITIEKRPCELSYTPQDIGIIRNFILNHYAAATNKLQPLALLGILFTFFTGIRCGELAALKVTDYDAEHSQLLIERTETKNQKTNTYSIKPPKTKASNRNIYLAADANEILGLIFAIREKMGIESEFFFTDRDGKRLNCPRFVKTIETINLRLSLPYNRSMHDIRRTYASIQYLKNVPVQVIQRQLGHETIQQTFEYIKDLITEQEGKMYLERAVLFAESGETTPSNNVIHFQTALTANPYRKAH